MCVLLCFSLFFAGGTESQLDLQPPAEADGPAPAAGAAQASGSQPCGPGAAAAGRAEEPGELREEETPTADPGAQGEGDRELPAQGICPLCQRHTVVQTNLFLYWENSGL